MMCRLNSTLQHAHNSAVSSFQKETLKACGISSDQIIDSIWRPHICAKEIIAISRTGINGFFDKHTVSFLRQIYNSQLSTKQSRKIYLNRKNVRHRKILNEKEIENLLLAYGFESICLDDLSVGEQANLLSSSEIVVSGHGASLTNLVFCQPGTKVLELFQRRNVHPIYWGISNLLHLDYYYIKSMPSQSFQSKAEEDNNFSDMVFDISEVERSLRLMNVTKGINDLHSVQ